MRSLAAGVLLATAALAACQSKPAPTPGAPAAPQAGPAPARPYAFTLRDLALATALDARLARLSLAASEVEAALAGAPAQRARAKELLPAVDAARAETERAAEAVQNPLDRPGAARTGAAAKQYADRLAAAVAASAAPLTPELAAARAALGEAIAAYRQSRAAWRFDAPEPQGAEREFAEARRDMERAESGVMSRTRVAPREEGHEPDAAAARMAGRMGVERAKAAAARLAPVLAPQAARYAAAQERVLEAVYAIQAAPEGERPGLARGYHAAKADALAALADYFAALAAR